MTSYFSKKAVKRQYRDCYFIKLLTVDEEKPMWLVGGHSPLLTLPPLAVLDI